MIKKWGILIKKEFESLEFTGLEIPRDYNINRREKFGKKEKRNEYGGKYEVFA
ncbi:hypothetical protein [Anaeromicropila populeti]|uniref:hypothetical protein n=1 Tax=Anaeromicropila populeti TaxID=37658 RepID=UPI0015A5F1B2|nr:hypothetical protein [Anaeromicropila populeti]